MLFERLKPKIWSGVWKAIVELRRLNCSVSSTSAPVTGSTRGRVASSPSTWLLRFSVLLAVSPGVQVSQLPMLIGREVMFSEGKVRSTRSCPVYWVWFPPRFSEKGPRCVWKVAFERIVASAASGEMAPSRWSTVFCA